jgi:hypothetical protein
MIHEYLLQQAILLPARLFSFGLLDGPQVVGVSRNGRLTRTRPAHHLAGVHKRDAPHSARLGPRRRAQTWHALLIAPCALREAHGKGQVPASLGWAGAMQASVSAASRRHSRIIRANNAARERFTNKIGDAQKGVQQGHKEREPRSVRVWYVRSARD